MWYQGKFFKYAIGLVLILTIIFLLGQDQFFLMPFKNLIAILFFPILLSGLLYYLFRPIVNLLVKRKIPRTLSILITFLLFIGLFTAISFYAGSIIRNETNQLIDDFPKYFQTTKEKTEDIMKDQRLDFLFTGNIKDQVISALQKAAPFISNGIFGTLSAITNIATTLIIVPFILFYFLKDGNGFSPRIIKVVPKKYKKTISEFLEDIDKTLSAYITGQAIIATVIGVLMYIGYLVIDLKYALILAIFALITAFIPLFGSFIGVVPAILVGLSDSPLKALYIVIIALIVQQLEGNLISPQLIGKRLNIHPLTLIILFLVTGSLFGFVGMLIAVPTYAVGKIFVGATVKVYKLRGV